VRIVRGDFKKMEGEITRVNPKRCVIYVEGASTTKVDGTQVQRPIHPSNVVLLSLAEDRRRSEALKRRSKVG
jgi:large subunit ribosomal protein L24